MTTFYYRPDPPNIDKRYQLDRPFADLYLKGPFKEWIEFHPLIDSGSDITILPFNIGKLLGFTIFPDKIVYLGRIYGKMPVVYKILRMKIGDKEFDCHIAWAIRENSQPLLGRTDVFDQFTITFKQTEGKIIFEEK
jgi:hypothetical protein